MDIREIRSDLIMTDFYFSECSIKRRMKIEDDKLKINIEKSVDSDGDTFHVQVKLTITHEGGDLDISVTANAVFQISGSMIENREKVVQENTIAIMFPFIRSEVTLLTSQPGMTPIVLPTINTRKLV